MTQHRLLPESLTGLKKNSSMPAILHSGGDSGSNTSSCNSSSPSSPAYTSQNASSDTVTSPSPTPPTQSHEGGHSQTQFNFPGILIDFLFHIRLVRFRSKMFRLAPKGTNPGLFQIRFQYILGPIGTILDPNLTSLI